MNKIFNEFVKKSCEVFNVDQDDFFSKGKNPVKSDARYLTYFLCARAGLRNNVIVHLMTKNGLNVNKSDVSRGVKKWQERVIYDTDFLSLVKEIEENV